MSQEPEPAEPLPLHIGGDLGRRVRHRRHQLGLSREALARRAGMSADYVAFIEEEPAEPEANAIIVLARALGVSREELRGAPPVAGSRRPLDD